MPSYGYKAPSYGSQITPKMQPLKPYSLAKAASGAPTVGDPFGLLNRAGPSTPLIDGSIAAPKPSRPQTPAPQGPVSNAPAPSPQTQQQQAPAAQAPVYDLNTDPALQAVNAFTGRSDEQARADFDQQRRDTLLQYGDQELVRRLLGDETLAKAAGQNPTSTLAGLKQTRDVSLRDLLNGLTSGGHHLGFSGYRVQQEGELGNQYQNALAQAAAGVNSRLGGLSAALQAALEANAGQRASALGDAYSRRQADALANPPLLNDLAASAPPLVGGDTAIPDSRSVGAGNLFSLPQTADDYLSALVRAAATRRPIAL